LRLTPPKSADLAPRRSVLRIRRARAARRSGNRYASHATYPAVWGRGACDIRSGMQQPAIDTVFVDVGGTLWPNAWPLTPALRDGRVEAVSSAVDVDPSRGRSLLTSVVEQIDEGLAIPLDEAADVVIRRVLDGHRLDASPATIRRLRQALCLNLGELVTPFAYADALLSGIRALGLRCIILSNTTFRDAEVYARDFAALHWTDWIDACVTSVDVGFAKPDRRIFTAALDAAASDPRRCVMIGNSERADIAPAAELGMRTILVAIEVPLPPSTKASTSVASLRGALAVLRSWVTT
jgi:FMN phosphatase YigB (HAD superfamily)